MNENDTLQMLRWGDFPEITAPELTDQFKQAAKKEDWLFRNGFLNDHFKDWQTARNGPSRNWVFTVKFSDVCDYSKEYLNLKFN